MNNKYSDFIMKKDFIYGVLIIVFSFIVYLNSINGKFDIMIFPRIIAFLIFCLGIAAFLQSFKKDNNKSKRKTNYYFMELCICTFMILIMFFVNVIGFYTSIFLICCVIYGMLEYLAGNKGMKSIINILLFSFLATFCLFLIFNRLLNIITPVGYMI